MAIITNMTTVVNGTPTAATLANAAKGNLGSASGSYIMGYLDNANLCLTKLKEVKNLVTALVNTTDAADPLLTTLNTILSDLT